MTIIGPGITVGPGITIFGSSGGGGNLYSFSSFTFTNAGVQGSAGPTLANCTSSYNTVANPWLLNTSYFNVTTQGIQTWTVPATGTYNITVAGARGGYNVTSNIAPGNGATLTTQVSLTQGQQLNVVVGQAGGNSSAATGSFPGGAGGGGTFVYDSSNVTYYAVAGGGGGAAATLTNLLTAQANAHGKYNTTSGNSISIQSGFWANGGIGGAGGNVSNRSIAPGGLGTLGGGAGAGILGNGQTGGANTAISGRSQVGNWVGGIKLTVGNVGGFGGGGSSGAADTTYQNSYSFSGGGGGYSGGGGGGNGGNSDGQYGGGGGSYYAGSLISGTSGNNNGQGYCTITVV